MSDQTECCSAPSPGAFPACYLCEKILSHSTKTDVGETIMPDKEKRNTSSIDTKKGVNMLIFVQKSVYLIL